jgi:outer membrane protein insertion porin family
MRHFLRRRHLAKTSFAAFCLGFSVSGSAAAQMGGMGGGGDNAPAFSEPKFSDRVYEAGGPRARLAKDGAMILSVVVQGNRSVTESYILTNMQSRPDRVFDQQTYNQDIASLYRTELFSKIESFSSETPEGVHLKLVVYERPIVRNVYFTGNRAIEDRTLDKHAGLHPGDPRDPIRINSAKSRLIEYYQDQGMNQVDIQVRKGLNASESDVDFYISEGPVERLRSISIIGNQLISTDWLKAKIKTKIYPILLPPKFSDNKAEDDRQFILGHYRSLGYFDARVEIRKDYNAYGDRVDVTFVVVEGAQYHIGTVSISGTKRYQPEELLPYMRIKQGTPFNFFDKQKDEAFLRELYGVQGHYFCDVVGELIYQPNNVVDVVYNVGEGDVYRVSDINIHLDGEYTRERVALHPLGQLRPGSIINSRHMDEASRRYRYSQIFNVDPSQGVVPTLKVEPPEDVIRDDF